MVTKGIVEEIIDTYSVRVRLPIYDSIENTKEATASKDLSIAVFSTFPNVDNLVNVGDVVWVSFEDDDISKPVIIGHLYKEHKENDVLSDLNVRKFNTNALTKLNENTYIGEITPNEIKMLGGVESNIQLQLNNIKETYIPQGGTLTKPLLATGGDSATAGKIILNQQGNGQITDIENSTLLGFINSLDLTVGHTSYNLRLRGSETRPKYNGKNLALADEVVHNTGGTINELSITKSSGLNYTGIEKATSDVNRAVWFSHADKIGTPTYDDDFKYNPSTNVLKVGFIEGGSKSSSWWNGRDNATLVVNNSNDYRPIISKKSLNGSWEQGTYSASAYPDQYIFSYVADSVYDGNQSTSNPINPTWGTTGAQIAFTSSGGIELSSSVVLRPGNITSSSGAEVSYNSTTKALEFIFT